MCKNFISVFFPKNLGDASANYVRVTMADRYVFEGQLSQQQFESSWVGTLPLERPNFPHYAVHIRTPKQSIHLTCSHIAVQGDQPPENRNAAHQLPYKVTFNIGYKYYKNAEKFQLYDPQFPVRLGQYHIFVAVGNTMLISQARIEEVDKNVKPKKNLYLSFAESSTRQNGK